MLSLHRLLLLRRFIVIFVFALISDDAGVVAHGGDGVAFSCVAKSQQLSQPPSFLVLRVRDHGQCRYVSGVVAST